MDSQQRTVWIRSATEPVDGEVTASYAEISRWLKGTSPAQIEDAGFGFDHGAAVLELVAGAMLTNASRLARVWGGPAAVDAQRTLRLLHATGSELAAKMRQVSHVLRMYGGVHLPEALKELERLEASGKTPQESAANASASPDTDGTTEARRALRTLNGQIVDLYHQVPEKFSYTLPIAETPGPGPGGYSPVDYSSVGRTTGGSHGGGRSSTVSGAGTADGNPQKGPDGGGHNGGQGLPGGSGGQGQDGAGSGGPGSGGSDPGGSGGPGSHGTQGPPAENGTGTGRGPGGETTVPSVIGGHDTVLKDGSGTTEVANFIPGNPVVPPTIQQGVIGPTGPTTTLMPASPPLAGPGFGAGAVPVPATLGGRNTTGGGSPMMPFIPPGGAVADGEGQSQERSTWLSEDHDVWNPRGDVIPPIIT